MHGHESAHHHDVDPLPRLGGPPVGERHELRRVDGVGNHRDRARVESRAEHQVFAAGVRHGDGVVDSREGELQSLCIGAVGRCEKVKEGEEGG